LVRGCTSVLLIFWFYSCQALAVALSRNVATNRLRHAPRILKTSQLYIKLAGRARRAAARARNRDAAVALTAARMLKQMCENHRT